ncbi:pentapeptide repeat-containing protein [Streptomyces iconiensis]|uniref:Pentapeptide repeat-containing protein n=1 Tax=Streptomyces iconiensis TaxID=1384038 RepID=A0ABT7A1R0_9ACTN|nr:pentapeptide repeat-containing protein [Streptomyces iconiensis]MDJ1135275.1 pentapeptide repeat-containing protein [Streptomyces iconiensis]
MVAGLYGRCLRHLLDEERGVVLAEWEPGGDLDLRGTEVDAGLLAAVLERFRGEDGRLRIGAGRFAGAVFQGEVPFGRAVFSGEVDFSGAVFEGRARFPEARFVGACFAGAEFRAEASFYKAHFHDPGHVVAADVARFDRAVFEQEAVFARAVFPCEEGSRGPTFRHVVFRGETSFWGVVSGERVSFPHAVFMATSKLGPVVCKGELGLRAAHFMVPVVIEAVAPGILLGETRFEGPTVISARYARVNLDRVLLLHPCRVTTFTGLGDLDREPPLVAVLDALDQEYGPGPTVAVTSLRGVDAAMLLLAEVDLSGCAFAGAHHLDQIRLEGIWRLRSAPGGVRWARGLPRWCAKRQIINEEREWRALPGRRRPSRHDWGPPPAEPGAVPGLATLTTVYRQLRKAREDAKDEPGAADFYYGEMEMRRYSRGWRHAERWLLQAYWALSGYGLRASRALGWLVGAMLATVLLMLAVGLPDTPAREHLAGARVVGKQAPTLRAPFPARFNAERALKATDVVVNSVVFRASGQPLTRAGSYVEKGARFTGPVLLGLAVLAVRGRVKRG